MGLIDKIVDYAVSLRYEDLPAQVTEVVKKNVLDTLAVVVAGSSAEGCRELARLVKQWGGREEATLLVYGGKVPAPNAALLNSTVARARDFGDVHEEGKMGGAGHISETTIPVALILAEYRKEFKGKAMTGKDFILASTIISDLTCRLRIAAKGMSKELLAETIAPLAIAAAGGRMLGFDRAKIRDTMGVAYAQLCCNRQAITDGALTVRLQEGLSAKAGIMSLALADIGFTGARDILEGKYGLYPFFAHGELNPEALVGDLGQRFEIVNVSIKPYPCCKLTHGPIDGILDLARKHGIQPQDVERITIATNNFAYGLCGTVEKMTPADIVGGQFSYYYTAAAALARGNVTLDDFTPQAVSDPAVLALARKVQVVVDPAKDRLSALIPPVDIEIATTDGKSYRKTVQYVKGHPRNPMSLEECARKLTECWRYSARPLPEENIGRIVELATKLESLPDVTELIGLVS